MTGGGTTAVYRVAAVSLWALAIWHSWMSRGLFVDGGPTLVLMMHNHGYALFWDARQTLTAVTQAPAALALKLGVTDSHLLARLLSAGSLDRWIEALENAARLFARADAVNLDRKQTVLVSFLSLQSAMR